MNISSWCVAPSVAAELMIKLDRNYRVARIVGFVDESSSYAKRLQSLGFTQGVRVVFLRQAPFGDPIQLMVRGTRIALRRKELEALLLEAET